MDSIEIPFTINTSIIISTEERMGHSTLDQSYILSYLRQRKALFFWGGGGEGETQL